MLLGAEFGDEALETLIGELGPIVINECLWYPKSEKHVSFVEIEDVV